MQLQITVEEQQVTADQLWMLHMEMSRNDQSTLSQLCKWCNLNLDNFIF